MCVHRMECTRDNMECTNGMYARGTRIYMDARSGTYHQDRGGRVMCMFAWNAGVLTQPDVAIEDAAGAAPGQQQQGRPVPSSRGPVCLPSAATRSQSMLAFAFLFLFLSCFVCALGEGTHRRSRKSVPVDFGGGRSSSRAAIETMQLAKSNYEKSEHLQVNSA